MPITVKNFNSVFHPHKWIYHNATLWLISISSNWTSRLTIADKNLWATSTDITSQNSRWNLYQWWNNYWFANSWTLSYTTSQTNAQNYWPTNYYSWSTIYKAWAPATWWDSSNNANLWWQTTNTLVARRWPCPEWFHVASDSERANLITYWINIWAWSASNWSNAKDFLLIPFNNNYRHCQSSQNTQANTDRCIFWSSTNWESWKAAVCWIWVPWLTRFQDYTSNWYYIRPFKNVAVIPDSSWDLLYDWEAPLITTAWVYHNAWLWLISISKDWETWITIADKNLGASQVWNDWDTMTSYNCWSYYQWWNNCSFPFAWPTTSSQNTDNISSNWPWNYYTKCTWWARWYWTYTYSWSWSYRNDNLWWWVTWTNEAMQWPCPSWWHVMSYREADYFWNTFSNIVLKIPKVWYVQDANVIQARWSNAYIHIAEAPATAWWEWWVAESVKWNQCTLFIPWVWRTLWYIAMWYNIRPVKNEPVQPDTNTTWTKLN